MEKVFWLAPMAGVTDLAFRIMKRRYGVFGHKISMAFTEMVSSRALHYNDKKTMELLKTNEEDSPLGVQIFGSEPEIMGEAAAKICEMGIANIIDINMGCPARKIVKNGDGSALMRDLPLAEKVIRAVVREANVPVTVKMRIGLSDGDMTAIELAKIAEACGVCAVTVHGRTVEQEYRGRADWGKIGQVARSVRIPVVGNGDISAGFSVPDELAGVMVARGAYGGDLENAAEHLDLINEHKGGHIGVLEARKVMLWYLKGAREAAELKRRAVLATDFGEMKAIIREAREK